MLIVIATHNTSHGEVSMPVYFDDSDTFDFCIDVARRITLNRSKFGFEFLNNEAMVCIYWMSKGVLYDKQAAMKNLVFFRRYVKIPGQEPYWEEELVHENLASLRLPLSFGGVFSSEQRKIEVAPNKGKAGK